MLKNGRLRIMLQGHFRATSRRRVAISVDIPLVSIESGNSVQTIKRCYWDVKHFDEGLRSFGLTLTASNVAHIIKGYETVLQINRLPMQDPQRGKSGVQQFLTRTLP